MSAMSLESSEGAYFRRSPGIESYPHLWRISSRIVLRLFRCEMLPTISQESSLTDIFRKTNHITLHEIVVLMQ